MSTLLVKGKREDLFQKITGVLYTWTDLERTVFFQSHYQGQSVESISRSLKVDESIVHTILKKCERELYASLRGFNQNIHRTPITTAL